MPDSLKNKNPYRMLKRPYNSPQRHHKRDRSRLNGYSGFFECVLEAHTPLEVNYEQDGDFHEDPKVPGSSIKGVIRSIAEYIGGGCISVIDHRVDRYTQDWRPCSDNQKICPTCFLFGNLVKKKVFKGNVRISEAYPVVQDDKELYEKHNCIHLYQGGPVQKKKGRPYLHTAFYEVRKNSTKSNNTKKELFLQKFYHHQPSKQKGIKGKSRKGRNDSTLFPVKAGSQFGFRVDFTGLSDELLALLHYSLELQPGLLHKMGRGKAFGLGSVKIKVTKIHIEKDASWFLADAKPSNSLPQEVQKKRKKLEQDNRLNEMRMMLHFEGHRGISFQYPSYDWFNELDKRGHKVNSSIPLRLPEEILTEYNSNQAKDPKLPTIVASNITKTTKRVPPPAKREEKQAEGTVIRFKVERQGHSELVVEIDGTEKVFLFRRRDRNTIFARSFLELSNDEKEGKKIYLQWRELTKEGESSPTFYVESAKLVDQ